MPLIIDQERPVPAVDVEHTASSERYKYLERDWMYALKAKALGCVGRPSDHEVRMKGVHEAIEDDWVWITLRTNDFDMVDAAVGRGDDINQWLESVENHYEVVDWLDDIPDDLSDSILSDLDLLDGLDGLDGYAANFGDFDSVDGSDDSDMEDTNDGDGSDEE